MKILGLFLRPFEALFIAVWRRRGKEGKSRGWTPNRFFFGSALKKGRKSKTKWKEKDVFIGNTLVAVVVVVSTVCVAFNIPAMSASTFSSSSDPAGVTDQTYRRCLSVATGSLLAEAGFDTASAAALETLTESLQSFLCELGRSTRAFTELACRNRPLPADVLLALTEMGVRPEGLYSYAFRGTRRCLAAPAAAGPPRPAAILHTGDRRRHRPGGVIPENFVEFPDSHSFVRTPTHKQPVTDYESVREKSASQKRDVERALTRFVAKTGRTHSLFNTDDTNLFPLVSCDRVAPDQPVLPAYVSALLFKDQLFEEDESEYAPKPKKSKKEEEKEAKEKAKKEGKKGGKGKDKKKKKKEVEEEEEDEEEGVVEEGEEAKEGEEDKDKEEEKEGKEDVIDNPFLRPARISRPPVLVKRT